MTRTPWTTKEISNLADLYAQGLSRAELAEALGRPWTSIKSMICSRNMRRAVRPESIITTTGVGGFFCAAHADKDTGVLHGHTWEVTAWFRSHCPHDAVALQGKLNDALAVLDHSVLPDELAWGEAIARHILAQFRDCIEVVVSRPAERIYAKAVRK